MLHKKCYVRPHFFLLKLPPLAFSTPPLSLHLFAPFVISLSFALLVISSGQTEKEIICLWVFSDTLQVVKLLSLSIKGFRVLWMHLSFRFVQHVEMPLSSRWHKSSDICQREHIITFRHERSCAGNKVWTGQHLIYELWHDKKRVMVWTQLMNQHPPTCHADSY